MIDTLVHLSSSIPGLLSARIRRLRETNPLADWADESLIYAPGERVNIGVKIPLEHMAGYKNEQAWLYPNYITYMDRTAHNHVAIQRFKGLLDDLCRSQLRLEGVFHNRDKDGSHFMGVKIRVPGDTESPRLIESALISQAKLIMTDSDGSMTDQVIDNDEDSKDDEVYNYSIVKKKKEGENAALSSLSSSFAIQKESEVKKPSSPSSSTLATTYSHDSPSPSVMSVTNPTLPIDSRTPCPQCSCTKIEWGVFTGTCQQCKFVIEDNVPG
jgi:hypothetical protein